MKQNFTYQFFLKRFIYLLLVIQLWANVVSHCCWIADSESEFINICDTEEEDNKKEKNDKYRVGLYALKFEPSTSQIISPHFEGLLSIFYREITTPPPKFSIS